MKIVLVQLIGKGGTQLYLSQLAAALANKDIDVTVVIGRYLFDPKHYENPKIKIILVDSAPSYLKMGLKLFNPLVHYNLNIIINKEKPDVVHMVFEDLISGVNFCILKMQGHKLVLTEHNPRPHKGDSIFSYLNQQFTKYLVRNISNKIIVHGDNIKSILVKKRIQHRKIHVIPMGDFSFYTKWTSQLPEEVNSILFFGLIRDYKGLEYLISAVPIIVSKIPNLNVIVAGSGDFSKYESIIKDKKYFEIHNRYIEDEEVASFFQRASVIVLPYIEASQSAIVPIAYAFKKPVVVTNVGSLPEIVNDGITGFIIPPFDSESIAQAVIKLLNDKEQRLEMGRNGHEWMEANISWSEVAENTIEIYKEILCD